MTAIAKPGSDEYGAYYGDYVARVPDGEILTILVEQHDEFQRMVEGLTEEQAAQAFAPGEWTIKEVVGHLGDAERLFSFRALCFSRGERAPLPGFDQDDYVRESNFGARGLADLLQELAQLRVANLITFRHFTPEMTLRRGVASDNEVSVRALVYILAGHFNYHISDLREKYLPAITGA